MPPAEGGDVIYMSEPLDRPHRSRGDLQAQVARQRPCDLHHRQRYVLNGHRRPFEVFINSKNMEHFAWTVGLTRMISAVFRRGGDVSFVVEELKAVFDPRGGPG
jgi:ribonucleoside-diphosphate reductase alpha chain